MAIIKCTCEHKFQDEEHGKGKRVHTPINKKDQSGWRCTVCELKKSGSAARG